MSECSELGKKIIDGIIKREGGYVNNPDDRGGKTKYGVTEAVAKANGYQGAMVDLPLEVAFHIYANQYWVEPGFSKIEALSPAIAEELADTGVMMGPKTAVVFLQRLLNVFNKQQADYKDISKDGVMGAGTISALESYLKARRSDGITVMVTALNCLQGERCVSISESREKNETFTYGWFRERILIRGDKK